MVAAVTSLPRVRFFIFHFESGLVLKIVFEKVFLGAFFAIFFIFHFRALLTEEMEKEHAHINSGGFNKLATCSLLSSFCFKCVHLSFFLNWLCTRVCKDLARSSHTPQTMLAPRRYTLFFSFASHSLHPPSPRSSHVHSLATRLSFWPRPTVTPPPWSSSWRQARTRRRRAG